MFCNKPKNVTRSVPAKRNRKRKKKSPYPHCDKRPKHSDSISSSSQTSLATAMSTWAQTYTEAATWQLKHQVAYWKARAKALEYENRVLHDTIKKNYFKQTAEPEPASSRLAADDSSEADDENVEEESVSDEQDDDDFEVSEEFIEFLKQNAKYKEDARKERERLKALREAENSETVEVEPVESSEEKQARYIELYGDGWERIMALETSLMCDFIDICDKEQPEFWPNIPFNFV